jgi:hypothetical protein
MMGNYPAIQFMIRFMIYDLLASTNTRNYVIRIRDRDSLKVVVQRMPGLKILQTCRYINDEALFLHEQLKATKAEPTRLLVHWRKWGTLPMLAAFQCAETNAEVCEGSKDHCWLLIKTTTPFGHKKSRVHPPCDLSSHEKFHRLFRSGHTPNKIELAMECDIDVDCRLFQLNSFHSRFDNWLSAQDLDLDLTIRLAPVDATTRDKLEKLQASIKEAGVKSWTERTGRRST